MPISRRNLVKKLKEFGFRGPYWGGRHQFMPALLNHEVKLKAFNWDEGSTENSRSKSS